MIEKIISGGQIGADIAGLRAAREMGIETGGWAPKGWRILGGSNPQLAEYGLVEHPSHNYPPRTRMNARNSDGTIRFAIDFTTAGERCTLREVMQAGKPHFDVLLLPIKTTWVPIESVDAVADWIVENNIRVLNVAGNGRREIEPIVEAFLKDLVERLRWLEESQ